MRQQIHKIALALLLSALASVSSFALTNSKQNMDDVLANYRYPVQYATLSDTLQLAYIDEGKGQPLIFIHGLATYLPQWYLTIEGLKSKFRCIAIDLPGYGRSSKGNYPAKLSFHARIINQFIKDLELVNPVLVGHSMGGQIAVKTVLQHSELYKKLILLAPAGFEIFSESQKAAIKSVTSVSSIRNASEKQIRANWKVNFYDMPEEAEFMIEDRIHMRDSEDFPMYCQAVVNGVYGMLNEPISSQLKKLKTETLIVYGVNDALIPNRFLHPKLTTKSVAEVGMRKIPNATLTLLENCGHFIPFDRPNTLNDRIATFLS